MTLLNHLNYFNNISTMLCAPLEQFQIISTSTQLWFFFFDSYINNCLIVNLLGLFFFFRPFQSMLKIHTIVFFNPWIRFFELVYNLPIYVMNELIPSKSNDYFIMLLTIYSFILFNNLIGLLPYSFTLTSHLYVSFMLSFSIFFGVNIISYTKYGLKLFELFLPANTSVFLAAILVPLEFISHLIKPVSLGARLFINLMAGHTLLKVILGFAWNILSLEEFFLLFLPFVILILLFVLELGVALIQTYVFITLTCIYIQDSDPS